MHLSKWGEHVLKCFVVGLESLFYLKFAWLSVSLLDPLIELFGLTQNDLYFWNDVDYVFLGKGSFALAAKVIFFLQYDAQTDTEISQNRDLAELKLEVWGLIC